MRLILAAVATVVWSTHALAVCSCQCVNGAAVPRCTTKTETVPVCPASTCQAAAAPAAAAQGPSAPAEITTTIAPSTTTPESFSPQPYPPKPIPPRARIEAPVESVTPNAPRGPRARTISPSSTDSGSITRPDIPAVVPPNSSALCYQHQLYNPETKEYEWVESCD